MPDRTDVDVLKARGRDALKLSNKYMVDRLPEPLRSASRAGLGRIEEWFLEARPPAVAVVGQPAAGLRTLINALFGEPVGGTGPARQIVRGGKWNAYVNECGALLVLDTRDVHRVSADAGEETDFALQKVQSSLDEQCPDVFLLIVRADSVRLGVPSELETLRTLRTYAKRKYGIEPPVVGVLTHLDALPPVGGELTSDVKQASIARERNELLDQVEQALDEEIRVFPISAVMEFGADGAVLSDCRWNVDTFAGHIFDLLPASAQVQFVRITHLRQAQRKLARGIVRGAAAAAGGVAATPIPIADMPLITSIQVAMISAIGYISGRQMSKRVAAEFIGSMGLNVGAGFAFRELSRALVKYVFPGAGNFVSAAVGAGATWALGEAATAYFVDDKGVEEARSIYTRLRRGSGSIGSRILSGGRAVGTCFASGSGRVRQGLTRRLRLGTSSSPRLPVAEEGPDGEQPVAG